MDMIMRWFLVHCAIKNIVEVGGFSISSTGFYRKTAISALSIPVLRSSNTDLVEKVPPCFIPEG